MSFSECWCELLGAAEALPADATLTTPLSQKDFQITDTQEYRIIIEFHPSGEPRPLQREQFETLYRRIQETTGGFELSRIPTDAEPYAALLTLHQDFEVDDAASAIVAPTPTSTPTADTPTEATTDVKSTTDAAVYTEGLLLVNMLAQQSTTPIANLDTTTLIDIYTLLSDVQYSANDLRQNISELILDRIDRDEPMRAQFGSVQRATRRTKTLKNDEEVIATLENAGVNRDRILGVDPEKVDEALDVTTLSDEDVYNIDEQTYVRKADVDEDVKESRLQGLKDRLAKSDDDDIEEVRREIADLEARIDDLVEFEPGTEYYTE